MAPCALFFLFFLFPLSSAQWPRTRARRTAFISLLDHSVMKTSSCPPFFFIHIYTHAHARTQLYKLFLKKIERTNDESMSLLIFVEIFREKSLSLSFRKYCLPLAFLVCPLLFLATDIIFSHFGRKIGILIWTSHVQLEESRVTPLDRCFFLARNFSFFF